MNRVTLALLLAGSLVLPSTSASAAEFIYSGILTGDQEVPVVLSPGIGSATVTYDDLLHTMRVQVSFSGLLGTTTASHIHVRVGDPPAVSGGVATQTPTFGGFPLGVQSGTYDHLFDLTQAASWNAAFIASNGGTAAGAESAFALALQQGRAYLNVHTNLYGGGEIRANLAAVPEPAAWAMMLVGFLGLGAAMRRAHARPQAVVSYT